MNNSASSPRSFARAVEPDLVVSAVGQVDLGDEALSRDIAAGMAEVETVLRAELAKGEDFLVDKVLHLAQAGGKRFRPMFALLASEFGDRPRNADVLKAAAVVEMVHLATLYHDDVMDEAERRRGVPSANARWNNSVAILAGDILLSHASTLMAQLGTETVAHFALTFGELVTGQMRETVGAGEGDPIEHYMKVIYEKTGVLIASAGYLGSLHAGASPETIAALQGYGRAVGMVFQIVDDIIDIFSEAAESGKTPGTDLREGVFTLPVLYAMAEDSPVGEALRAELSGPVTSDAQLERVLGLLDQSQGRARTLEVVHRYLREAESYVDQLPDIPAARALRHLAVFSASRVG